jgi:hypothetical protein
MNTFYWHVNVLQTSALFSYAQAPLAPPKTQPTNGATLTLFKVPERTHLMSEKGDWPALTDGDVQLREGDTMEKPSETIDLTAVETETLAMLEAKDIGDLGNDLDEPDELLATARDAYSQINADDSQE